MVYVNIEAPKVAHNIKSENLRTYEIQRESATSQRTKP